jgi:hypothetical protein
MGSSLKYGLECGAGAVAEGRFDRPIYGQILACVDWIRRLPYSVKVVGREDNNHFKLGE